VNYQFDIELATEYGVDEAVMLHNLIFWLRKNKTGDKNIIDDRAWTYGSAKSYENLFPFWSGRQIARVLRSLVDQGVILAENHNNHKYDRTKWYALQDETLLQLPFYVSVNGTTHNVQPIPDGNTDSNTDSNTYNQEGFDRCWTIYQKKGNKSQAFKYWKKLTDDQREAVEVAIPAYVSSRPEKKFRKDFQGWINPEYKRWEDEVEAAAQVVPDSMKGFMR